MHTDLAAFRSAHLSTYRHFGLGHHRLVAHQDGSVIALHHEVVLGRLSEVDKLLLVLHSTESI